MALFENREGLRAFLKANDKELCESCGCCELVTESCDASSRLRRRRNARHGAIVSDMERIALDFHKTIEGEYGCQGVVCPGVQRLIVAFTALKGHGQRSDRSALPDVAAPASPQDWIETRLRQEWWVGHGCSFHALYGDDGEMQCNASTCHRDFKREPMGALRVHVEQRRLTIAAAAVRDGAAPSSAPLDLAVIDRRLEEVATMHQDSGGSTTFLGAYWEGYAEGLKYAKSSAMTDLGAAHGSRASSETQK